MHGAWLGWVVGLVGPIGAADDAAELEAFERHVRPLLHARCVACHGPEVALGGLRVDPPSALLVGGDSGPAVVPGRPEESLLIAVVRHERAGLEMPWDEEALSDREVRHLVRWIRAGALIPVETLEDVAGRPPRREWRDAFDAVPQVPEVEDGGWARNDVDRFVWAGRARQGLGVPAALSRHDWLRRLHIDLTGLPPTARDHDDHAAEVARVGEDAADALVIDRLLHSEHRAERLARQWLDVARFGEDDVRPQAADETGVERYLSAWTYRDWVVRAFHRDRPWDSFVRASIAGDLLDGAESTDAIGGLGLLGAGPWYYDNGTPLDDRADEVQDRVDVVFRGFMGVTLACARCHDHKHDPLRQAEYQGVASLFANTEYHEVPLDPEAYAAEQSRRAALQALVDEEWAFLRTAREQRARALTSHAGAWLHAAWYVMGPRAESPRAVAGAERLDLAQLERWVEWLEEDAARHPALAAWCATLGEDDESKARSAGDVFAQHLRATAANQRTHRERNAILEARYVPDATERRRRQLPNGYLALLEPVDFETAALEPDDHRLWQAVYRFWDAGERQGVLWLDGWELERDLPPTEVRYLRHLRQRQEALRAAADPMGGTVWMAVRDLEVDRRDPARLHLRGDPTRLGETVTPQWPVGLGGGPSSEPLDRRGLALRLSRHPLADRVAVCRVWQWTFGAPLIATPGDLGWMGAPPADDALLEWLTSWFVAHGRSVRALQALLVDSATFRSITPWHPARRMDAESLRDALWLAAGALDRSIGGPSSNWSPGFRRRALYGRISREQLDGYLRTFDVPDPRLSSHQRAVTAVPAQARFFQNSETLTLCVDAWFDRFETGGRSTADAVTQAFRDALGRDPAGREQERVAAYLGPPPVAAQRWRGLFRSLLSTEEFRTVR